MIDAGTAHKRGHSTQGCQCDNVRHAFLHSDISSIHFLVLCNLASHCATVLIHFAHLSLSRRVHGSIRGGGL